MKFSRLGIGAAALLWIAAAVPTAAQDSILVQHVVGVTVARTGEALVVTAAGTVPIAGFANAALRPRPDLATVEGGYVLDFVATPPPRDKPTAQVVTRLAATFRIEPREAGTIRVVQVRGALGSRTVQAPGAR